MSTWVITAGSERAELGPASTGDVTFIVTNQGTQADEAVFEPVPGDGAAKTWFTVKQPQEHVEPGKSVRFLVTTAVPAGSPAGSYWLQGRVYSASTAPEESSALSNRVTFDVKQAPAPSKPWWLLAVAGLVVAVVVVGAFLLLRPNEPATVTVPDLTTGKSLDQVKKRLETLGLAVGTVKYRQQPSDAGTVVKQSLTPNTTVDKGTKVNLVVAVKLDTPVLQSPASGTTVAAGTPLPALTWAPVKYAASYQVDVRKESCRLIILRDAEPSCGFGPPAPATTTDASFTPDLTFSFEGPPNKSLILRLFNDSGLVEWRVTAVDEFGNPGPASEFVTFKRAK